MHQKFKNAYQVFGRSYITKLLHNLNETPQKRNVAMKNIIAEADSRIADPVGGSYRVVKQQCADLSRLQWKVAQQELELQQLRRQVNANVAMAQPSLYQEQGYQNLGEQIGNANQGQGNLLHQGEGNFVQGYGQRIRQEQASIDAQSRAYVHPPSPSSSTASSRT
ncbi:PREDICTED: LOB domain-containing protein 6-like [Fragaria vesca subsp. vesca]